MGFMNSIDLAWLIRTNDFQRIEHRQIRFRWAISLSRPLTRTAAARLYHAAQFYDLRPCQCVLTCPRKLTLPPVRTEFVANVPCQFSRQMPCVWTIGAPLGPGIVQRRQRNSDSRLRLPTLSRHDMCHHRFKFEDPQAMAPVLSSMPARIPARASVQRI